MSTFSGPAYLEGTWTPVITFTTPGDLAVTYSTHIGVYQRIGNLVCATFAIATSAFTYTTASSVCNITGLPFISAATGLWTGPLRWQGITKVSYTQICLQLAASASLMTLVASGSAQAASTLTTTDIPTAGSISWRGSIMYATA